VRHEELVEAIWGKVVMSDSVLRSHIRALRQVLGAELVETVVGRGYRFLVDVHELAAASQPRDKEPGAIRADARSSSLVDRVVELAALRAALESARQGKRQLVFVTGEAGVGKTTLVDAFLEDVAAEGTAWIARGSCVEQYGSGEAYLPVLAAIGHLCGGPGGERIVEVVARHAPTWLGQVPALVSRDRLEELRRHAEASQAGLLREVGEALTALSGDRPVVLALDDLQWSDRSTVELLAFLGRRREADRLLVIGTYRPTDLSRAHPLTQVLGELIAHKQASPLPLATFSEEGVAEYVDRRFAGHAFPRALATTVYRTTGGNPLFVVTLIDDLEGREMIRPVEGRWELATTVEDVASRRPDSIRRLLDTQIDRLSANEQRILEAASVAGTTFTAGVVAHALNVPVDDVDSCCESLASEHRFLRYLGTETWPDGTVQSRYSFAHALYQHAALARTRSVRLWHRRIAERLELGYAEQSEAIASELAEQFDEGHAFARAAHYRALAGERATRRHGSYEALGHFERALALVAHLPEGRERDDLELRILDGLGPCLVKTSASGTPGIVPTLARAAELASRLGRQEELCLALVRMQYWRLVRGELRQVSEHADEVTRLAARMKDASHGESGARMSSIASLYRGRLSEAADGFARVSSTSVDANDGHPSAQSAQSLLAWLSGRPDHAMELGRAAVSRAETLGDPFSVAAALLDLGGVSLLRRDVARVREYGQRGLDLATEGHFARLQARFQLLLHWAASEVAPATPAARPEGLFDEREAPRTGETRDSLVLVDIYARAGRDQVALEMISETMELIEETDERWAEPELHRVRGELLTSTDSKHAERSFIKSIEVARRQSSSSFELRATMSLCRFHGGARRKKALDDLRRLFETFTEGFETGDLLDAKALLHAR
jgi:hypothetical protein